MKLNPLVISVFFVISSLTPVFGDIYINEILTSNALTNVDPDYNEHVDWIEIYNAGLSPVNLEGYFLTDDLSDETMYQVPSGIIVASEGYVLFWADNMNNGTHVNFKLDRDGEEVGIFNPQGDLVDSLVYDYQYTDVSYGRKPDGAEDYFYYDHPTPQASNSSIGYNGKASIPIFSVTAGFYTQNQIIELSADSPSAVIRYTLDGSEPTVISSAYAAPLLIENRTGDANVYSEIQTNVGPLPFYPEWAPPSGEVFKATVLRAQVFIPGFLPSEIATNTYFIDNDIHNRYATLPVISIVSDYNHLFDDESGIYVPGDTYVSGDWLTGNYFQGWEKPGHIEFFETGGNLGFSEDVGIKIAGNTTPASPQKGLHVIARDQYGEDRIYYPVFENCISKAKNLTEFKRFVLRSWGSARGGQLLNDAFGHMLMAETELDIQAYIPAVVFINGEYWGLHSIREANKHSWYYQDHYGIDRDNPGYDIISHDGLREGDDQHFVEMANYFNTHDMSLPGNYEYIKTQMDVENLIMYIGHSVYSVKLDWPHRNEAMWRPRTENGKWRWIQYDMDTCFNLPEALFDGVGNSHGEEYDMIRHVISSLEANPGLPSPSYFFVPLLANAEFKASFINWMADSLNSYFLPDRMHLLLDGMVSEIEPYMQEYSERWQINYEWEDHIGIMRDFIDNRPFFLRQHIIDEFSLSGTATLIVDVSDENRGTVRINSIEIDEETPGASNAPYPWIGTYFKDIPIQLQAIPNDGYEFDGWQGVSDDDSETVSIILTEDSSITATFKVINDNNNGNKDDNDRGDDGGGGGGSCFIDTTAKHISTGFSNILLFIFIGALLLCYIIDLKENCR